MLTYLKSTVDQGNKSWKPHAGIHRLVSMRQMPLLPFCCRLPDKGLWWYHLTEGLSFISLDIGTLQMTINNHIESDISLFHTVNVVLQIFHRWPNTTPW